MDRQGHKHADGDRLIDGESPGRTAAGRGFGLAAAAVGEALLIALGLFSIDG
jgi:hypothetical protein